MAAGPDGRAGHRRGAAGRCHTLYGAYGYLPAQAGRGSPVVLLSPGAAWVVGWKEQFPVLAREHSAYVVDLPGQRYTVARSALWLEPGRHDRGELRPRPAAGLPGAGQPAADRLPPGRPRPVTQPGSPDRPAELLGGLVRAAQRGDALAMNDLLDLLAPYVGRLCGPIALQEGPDAA